MYSVIVALSSSCIFHIIIIAFIIAAVSFDVPGAVSAFCIIAIMLPAGEADPELEPEADAVADAEAWPFACTETVAIREARRRKATICFMETNNEKI